MKVQNQSSSLILKSILIVCLMGLLGHASSQIHKLETINFLNKTSYIIGEASDLMYYYDNYSTQGDLSKAVNHQSYAKLLCQLGVYNKAIQHSDIARQYALSIIYYCDNYWENYYRPYFYHDYWYFKDGRYYNSYRYSGYYKPQQAPRPNHYEYDKHSPQDNTMRPNNNHFNYQNPRGMANATTGVHATAKNISRYNLTNTGTLETKDFNTWNKAYYSTEELSIIKQTPIVERKDLEKELNNTAEIKKVSSDKEARQIMSSPFSNDIKTYKTEHAEESAKITISRPEQFGTTAKTTRSTANLKTNIATSPTSTNHRNVNNINVITEKNSSTTNATTNRSSSVQVKQPQTPTSTTNSKVTSSNGKPTNTQQHQQNVNTPKNSNSTTTQPSSNNTNRTTTNKNTSGTSNNRSPR